MEVGYILALSKNNHPEGYRNLQGDFSGKGGIRTLGGPEPTTVFETVPFNHSGTFPIVEQVGNLLITAAQIISQISVIECKSG